MLSDLQVEFKDGIWIFSASSSKLTPIESHRINSNYIFEIHVRRDLNGTDIELGDVDSEPNIPVQPITIRKLNSRFSTTETTGKLGNPR